MQRHAKNSTIVFNRWLAERAAVLDVSADRMAKLGKMNSNLIGATGFETAFEFTEEFAFALFVDAFENLKGFEMGRRMLSD